MSPSNNLTHDQRYQVVRAKVIEACPELMELTFGCRVERLGRYIGIGYSMDFKEVLDHRFVLDQNKNNPYKNDLIIVKRSPLWKKGHENECDKNCGAGDPWDFCQYYDKVLGHPIRLSHVLRALHKRIIPDEQHQLIVEADGLMIWQSMITTGDGEFGGWHSVDDVKWNLATDDLATASEETIQFLYDVLNPG